jgi:tripartite-type tricarboxylate transporter receptor subunit TctC
MKKLLALFLLAFGIANAQSHTFKFILSSGPGSGSDVSIETYAPCLKKQNINVLKDYKPGAEGLVALKALQAAQDTDNITHLLMGNFGLNTLSKFPGIDLLEDINPLVYMNSTPLVFVAKAGKYKSLDELVNENKGRMLNIGSPSASGTFLSDTIFKEMNVQFQVVPYKTSVQGLTDVVNGNLDMFVDTFIGARPLVEANRIQIMTSTFDKAYATKFNHSNVGTYSNKLAKSPIGLGLILSVQPSLDKDTRNIIIKAIHTCGKDTDVIQKLEANSSHPVFLSTNDIVRMVKQFSGKQ